MVKTYISFLIALLIISGSPSYAEQPKQQVSGDGSQMTNSTDYSTLLTALGEYGDMENAEDQLRSQKEKTIWIIVKQIDTISGYYAYLNTVKNGVYSTESQKNIDKLAKNLKTASKPDIDRIKKYLNEYFTGVLNLGFNIEPKAGWVFFDMEAKWRNASILQSLPPVISDGSELQFMNDKRIFIYIKKKWKILPNIE